MKKAIQLLLILICGYFLVLVLVTLWTFEVKLYRWPIFVYAAPFSIRAGDDINRIRLFERLARLGYGESPAPIPEPPPAPPFKAPWNYGNVPPELS